MLAVGSTTGFMQRKELQINADSILKAFAGLQYGAMVPGGVEALAWAVRLAWDEGWTVVTGDVQNGFPAENTAGLTTCKCTFIHVRAATAGAFVVYPLCAHNADAMNRQRDAMQLPERGAYGQQQTKHLAGPATRP